MDSALSFDPDLHIYRTGGVVLPSVTQVLAEMYDFKFVKPEVLKAAGEFGTAVHLVCELFDKNDLEYSSLDTALLPYLTAWKRFLSETSASVLEIERRYHHKAMGFAGTIDRLLEIDGKKVLVDIKTVSSLSPVVGIQLGAYERLILDNTEYTGLSRAAVQLCANGTYKYRMYADPMDWAAFASLICLKNWRLKNAA